MVELDFNPQEGERVEFYPQGIILEVLGRHITADGQVLLRLRSLQDGRLFENVTLDWLRYPADVRVRRALEHILPKVSWPEEFQDGRFVVKTDEMYDGTPRIMVNFYLKPDVIPSVEKAGDWNAFYSTLKRQIEPLVDTGDWLQFAAKEQRSALSAAS